MTKGGNKEMKVAITGKGGVGKTTFASSYQECLLMKVIELLL